MCLSAARSREDPVAWPCTSVAERPAMAFTLAISAEENAFSRPEWFKPLSWCALSWALLRPQGSLFDGHWPVSLKQPS